MMSQGRGGGLPRGGGRGVVVDGVEAMNKEKKRLLDLAELDKKREEKLREEQLRERAEQK